MAVQLDEKTDLLERMMTTFDAEHNRQIKEVRSGDYYPEISVLSDVDARLYFAYRLPNWPPHYLLVKLMRRLLWPIMRRQVFFNMACRDFSIQVHQTQRDMAQRNIELEQRIRDLEARVEKLSAQSEALRFPQR